MQAVRWTIVTICFVWIGRLQPEDTAVRFLLLAVGLAFFCWPNFAYYLVRLFRRANAT